MSSPLERLPQAQHRLLRRGRPGFAQPMLATLTHDYFSDPGWIYERKLDGERCLAVRHGGVRLFSRNQKPLNNHYPELAEALAGAGPDLVLDGEVVAFRRGVTSFARLQGRMQISDPDKARASGVAVYYYAFDLLHLDGWDTTALPQRARKSLLKQALTWADPLRYTPHRNTQGEAYHQQACRKGWEGVIAKRADAAYAHGRGKNWLKFKCAARQEFVIGGYTPPQGERIRFGALLLGYYRGDALIYAGKVGTGFDEAALRRLGGKLARLERSDSPFAGGGPPEGATWVEPRLVCEDGFTEWTRAGRLRHPRFLGLREDKAPRQVRREDRDGHG